MNFNFSPFPVLETDRLRLRALSSLDAQQIHELRSDPKIAELTGRVPSTGIEDALIHIKKIEDLIEHNESIYWVISFKDDPALAGTICFWNFDTENESAEIGYELLPEFQKKGIMGEAIKCVIDYGFEKMMVKTISAFPSMANASSVKLLENLGFQSDPLFHHNFHTNIEGMLTLTLKK
jgi:ribosomal-protein-alanine N-acetyltransferase